jgi:hypothetical protein
MQVQYEPWNRGEAWGFKITNGKYENTIISINNIELNEDSSCALDFNFYEKTYGLSEGDFSSEEFNSDMSSIINDILKKAVDEHENRDSNTTESYL